MKGEWELEGYLRVMFRLCIRRTMKDGFKLANSNTFESPQPIRLVVFGRTLGYLSSTISMSKES